MKKLIGDRSMIAYKNLESIRNEQKAVKKRIKVLKVTNWIDRNYPMVLLGLTVYTLLFIAILNY